MTSDLAAVPVEVEPTHEGDQTDFQEAGKLLYDIDYESAMRKQPLVVAFNGHQRSLIDAPPDVTGLPGHSAAGRSPIAASVGSTSRRTEGL